MPKSIILYFNGTSNTAKQIERQNEKYVYHSDVIRIYFNGCQDKSIGGSTPGIGMLNPNLDVAGKNVRKAFNENGCLDLDELKNIFGKTMVICPDIMEDTIEVQHITLMGYSRGAVTTFAVARHLNDLHIPMNIYAEEPVSGNSGMWAEKKSSEFSKNYDLRPFTYIRSATVLIGAYKVSSRAYINTFYRQMLPLFPTDCSTSLYLVPKRDHFTCVSHILNHQGDFLSSHHLIKSSVTYDTSNDPKMFIPKVLQQKHHRHVAGRLTILPEYIQFCFNEVLRRFDLLLPDHPSIKMIQALYALTFTSRFEKKMTILTTVINDTTEIGKATREFIIEFENINQYVFGGDTNEVVHAILSDFRAYVYNQLATVSILDLSLQASEDFSHKILIMLQGHEENLPKKLYKQYSALLITFLEKNCLFDLELIRCLDETETLTPIPSTPAACKI